MTEQDWLASDDPHPMCLWLTGCRPQPAAAGRRVWRASPRKLALYACACCWGAGPGLGADAEQCLEWNSGPARNPASWAMAWSGDQRRPPPAARAALLRDVVGNPFRPPAALAGRLTPDVYSLASAAYEDRLPDGRLDPARLAVLSDALEEAGCDDAGLLEHLRFPGPHYRGMWSLDLVLGKG